jgi:hypothetical protein
LGLSDDERAAKDKLLEVSGVLQASIEGIKLSDGNLIKEQGSFTRVLSLGVYPDLSVAQIHEPSPYTVAIARRTGCNVNEELPWC